MGKTSVMKNESERNPLTKPKAEKSHLISLDKPKIKQVSRKDGQIIPSRHISRKDQFYASKHLSSKRPPTRIPQVNNLKKEACASRPVLHSENQVAEALKSECSDPKVLEMHPEEVQTGKLADAFSVEKAVKLQMQEVESAEEHIDVEEVETVDVVNGGSNGELNGNGYSHDDSYDEKENNDKIQISLEEGEVVSDVSVANGEELSSLKSPTLRLKGHRRLSTSSRSSSVSSVPSVKQPASLALQMEVSMEEGEVLDNMEPLIIKGSAEDLEVSVSVPIADVGSEVEVVAESEAVESSNESEKETAEEPTEEKGLDNKVEKQKSKASKTVKSPAKPKAKYARSKSPKISKRNNSPALLPSEELEDESPFDPDYEPTEAKVKSPSKSPARRNKAASAKEVKEASETEEKSDSECGPRRSSRPRQTPQKYNSSLFIDSGVDSSYIDDRLNTSEAGFGTSIRSVRGRRSLRKSRNISALNASLHNESSPWEKEEQEQDFKVLSPCGGALSIHTSVVDSADSVASLKRKAEDEEDEKELKKLCVESTGELDGSVSSHTSSFFSIVTSPITLLRGKFRGAAVSCSTPVGHGEKKIDQGISGDESMVSANENEAPNAGNVSAVDPSDKKTEEVSQQGRSWCTVM